MSERWRMPCLSLVRCSSLLRHKNDRPRATAAPTSKGAVHSSKLLQDIVRAWLQNPKRVSSQVSSPSSWPLRRSRRRAARLRSALSASRIRREIAAVLVHLFAVSVGQCRSAGPTRSHDTDRRPFFPFAQEVCPVIDRLQSSCCAARAPVQFLDLLLQRHRFGEVRFREAGAVVKEAA